MSSSPIPQKVNVKSIISIFENQTIAVNNEPGRLIRRAKSMGSLNHRSYRTEPEPVVRIIEPVVRIMEPVQRTVTPERDLELSQIDQQIQHLQNTLNNSYKSYSRDTHIYCQNQIVFILTDICSLETKNNPKATNKKSELTETLKRLNKKLNALLPSTVTRPEHVPSTPVVTVVKSRPERVANIPRSKSSVEHKREVASPKKEKRVKQVEEIEDEVDAPALSVKSLKELFEKNTNANEGKAEFGSTKLSRKFNTFNGTSDLKYVTYSERLQSASQDLDAKWNRSSIKKELSVESSGSSIKNQNSVEDSGETLESYVSSRQVTNASDEEVEEEPENLTPDSLLSEESGSGSSSGESDGEASERENVEEES